MNILLITEFFPDSRGPEFTGGVEARSYFIAKYLKAKHQIKIINRQKKQVPATPFSIFSRLKFIGNAIAKGWRQPNIDVVEGSNFITYLPAFIVAKIKQVPAVAWYADVYQGSWIENVGLISGLAGSLVEYLSLKLPWDQVIAMSQSTKKKLIKAGIKSQKITVIYGGVQYQLIQKIKTKKFNRPTICTLSRLVVYKRIKDLIKAIKIIRKTHPQIQCLILGDGPERKNLSRLIKKLKLKANVKLLGNIKHQQALKILKRCHLFSLPSLVEGFGIATAEAMAAGTPFVNSRIPATVEITQNGQGGELFTSKNHRQLAQKILLLLTNKKLYQKKEQEGLHLAKKYDWQKIANQTMKVYANMLE